MYISLIKKYRAQQDNKKIPHFFSVFLSTVLLTLFIILLREGPLLQADSFSYLGNSPLRSPLYPVILQINRAFFGENNFHALISFQIIFGLFSTVFLSFKLKKLFSLDYTVVFLIILILLSPYYFGSSKFGNSIITEAICYPLFILAFSCLLEGLILKKTQKFICFLALTSLLILTRRQFLFLYPVFGFVLAYLFYFRKSTKIGFIVVSFTLSILTTHLLERSYQYLNHGHFITIPFTGIQLVTAPLFIANVEDAKAFENDFARNIFQAIRQKMLNKNISAYLENETGYYNLFMFTQNYNDICHRSLLPVLAEFNVGDMNEVDHFTTKMAFTLIKQNPKRYFNLYMNNIIYNMGGLYFCLLLAATFLLFLIQHLYKRDNLSLAILLALILSAANYSLIALVEPILRRYSVYTDTILISMLVIVIAIAMRSQTSTGNILVIPKNSLQG